MRSVLVLSCLLFLSAGVPARPAAAGELRLLGYKGKTDGAALFLETVQDNDRGYDRLYLLEKTYPANGERRRIPMIDDKTATGLIRAGDFELFMAIQQETLDKTAAQYREQGFQSPERVRVIQPSPRPGSFEFFWGETQVTVEVRPSGKRSLLVLKNGDAERTLARLDAPASGLNAPGLTPQTARATDLFQVALIGEGKVLVVVAGMWYREYSFSVGWETILFLPLKKTSRLWKLPYPVETRDSDWAPSRSGD